MIKKEIAAVAAALVAAATLSGCAANGDSVPSDAIENNAEVLLPSEGGLPSEGEEEVLAPAEGSVGTEEPEQEEEQVNEAVRPSVKTASYISVAGDNVNIRTGAGTGYSSLGAVQKGELLTCLGKEDGWYKTRYLNRTAYISSKYASLTEIYANENEDVEAVIAQGENLLGTPYVYGAVRLHDGNGNLYRGFSITKFDCSSLMQYMFYYGAGVLLNVNSRTQAAQGTAVNKSELQRGDLIFFTNASRYYNTGIERIGHVAIYLGDNYILHTSSDYAKIEQITSLRWSYYIQARRMI